MTTATPKGIGEVNGTLTYGLPAFAYTSEHYFQAEKREIFYRSWHCIGHQEHVSQPNRFLTGQVADQRVFVIRGKDDLLRGFFNVCQHRGHELLAQHHGERQVITCPYHAWTYGPTGKLLSARGCPLDASMDIDRHALKAIKVGVVAGFIFVNLDPDATPIEIYTADWLTKLREFGPDTSRLNTVFSTVHDVHCNWKLLIENSMECGHCESAHPDFCKQVRLDTYEINPVPWENTTFATSYMHEGAIDAGKSIQSMSVDTLTQFGYLYLWPNTEARILAGSPNFLMRTQVPIGPSLTRVINTLYYDSVDDCDIERYREQLHDSTFSEDIRLVESAQRGMRSLGFSQQTFMTPALVKHYSENDLVRFNTLVADAVGNPEALR